MIPILNQTDTRLEKAPPNARRFRQMAVVGNVSVGKTSLFDALCRHSDHAVNIPGSTFETTRGVVAVGHQAAPREVRKQCAACHTGRRQRRQCGGGAVFETGTCPGLGLLEKLGGGHLIHLYDTPGSGTLAAGGEDEMVARDLILSGEIDSLLVVADAKNLRRSLALALEAAAFGLPMVMALNMLDEAESMGIEIDDRALSERLGIEIARTVAVERQGIRTLADLIVGPARLSVAVTFPDAIEAAIADLLTCLGESAAASRGLAVLLLQGDRGAEQLVRRSVGDRNWSEIDAIVAATAQKCHSSLREIISETYYEAAKRIVDAVVTFSRVGPSLLVRFGRLAMQPIFGMATAAAVLAITYFWVGAFGATFVVDNLSEHLFEGLLIPLCDRGAALIPSAFVRDAIMDPSFGLLPTGLFLALGVVLPVLFCFYLLQAVLEDSGYLPRLAVLLDRFFRKIGLNGQSLIPLMLGFSCITMAIITTRMLPTKKERIILTLLLILGIPCAPLLAVMLVILGEMPWTATAALFGVIGTQILAAGYVSSRLLPGRQPDLILEIPKMRIPRVRIILSKTWRRTGHFMKEAIPIFVAASFAIFLFDRAGGLAALENLLRPFIRGVLGLPDEFVQVFIKTSIRRENGATELLNVRGRFDNVQVVVTMLVMTFLMPCINATIVIFKERGIKTSMVILTAVVIWAVVVGAAFNHICRTFGVTFS